MGPPEAGFSAAKNAITRHAEAVSPIYSGVTTTQHATSLAHLARPALWASLLLTALSFMLSPPPVSGQGTSAGAGAAAGTGAAVAAGRKAKNLAIVTIHGPIQGVMASSVKRRIDTAVRAGADAIVFDIDTPGGEVGAVLEICNAIKSCPVQNTVAWINPQAYSGGAIIALACREIVVNQPASFGDAMPVAMQAGGLRQAPPEILLKLLPPLINEVVDSARLYNKRFGGYYRDEYLVQAIVANDVSLWWIRHKQTGVTMAIDRVEFAMLFPGGSTGGPTRLASVRTDASITARAAAPAPVPADPAAAPAPGAGAVAPALPPDVVTVPSGSPKLAGIASQVAGNATIASVRPRLTPADAGQWELIDKITDGAGAATFSAADMLHYGLAANEVRTVNGVAELVPIVTDAELAAFFQAENIRRFDRTWSEGMVLIMTNPIVRGVLIVIFLVSLFVEMTHPGAILPGLIALLTLVALLAPPMLIGMASWWEVAAIIVGLGLLAVEAFVIPGFGVPGVLGVMFLLAGLVGTFLPQGQGVFPNSPREQDDLLWGVTTILLSMVTAGFGMYAVAKHFKSIPVIGRLVLRDPANNDENESLLAAMGPDPTALDVRVGETGVTLTPMRPAGRVEVGGRIIDAVAEVGYIGPGAQVRVVSAGGMRVGVEEVREAGAPKAPPAPERDYGQNNDA